MQGRSIEKSYETCNVLSLGNWEGARYIYTKPDGRMLIEIRTSIGAKTRKVFDREDVHLFDTTNEVVK